MAEAERIALGKQKEQLIFKLLSEREVVIHGEEIIAWEHSTADEDIHEKIDAWATTASGKKLSVQFKYRDAGVDLGIAAVRPFEFDLFKMDWRADTVRWDRDMKNKVDIIVCLADYQSKLIVANGHTVHKACINLLSALAKEDIFYAKRYTRPNMKGGTIQVVKDRGQGYSSGQMKLVIYLEEWLFRGDKGMVFDV
jgi:hypothetical protein